MNNLSILIHSFNQYSNLWKGCSEGWRNHYGQENVYFGTDLPTESHDYVGKLIFSGPGEWSDRLTKLLVQIPTDYVLYAQEDHWPVKSPPNLSEMLKIVSENDLFRLQLGMVNRFYTLSGSKIPLFFDPNSKYLVSHQPSIWKKSFLLDCLKPNETPWENEYKGTLRWQQTGQLREFIREKIAIWPCDWYRHMCIKGKTVES